MNADGINLELFPCAGGMAEGFRRAGIHFDVAIEWMPNHCASYEANLGHRPICMDVNDFLKIIKLGSKPVVNLLVADPPCFPRGTRIHTLDGERKIEEVVVGDQVLTSAGRYREVKETFHRQCSENLFAFECGYRPEPIRATSEHPFWIRRGDVTDWVAAKDVQAGDLMLIPFILEAPSVPNLLVRTRVRRRGGGFTLDEKPCRIDISNPNVAWLLGLYLAEGHRRGRDANASMSGITRREVVFSIADDEVAEVQRRGKYAAEHMTATKHGDSVTRMTINSPDWWALCGEFGDGAEAKFIPSWVYTMTPEWRTELLRGYTYGDGSSRQNTGTTNHIVEACTVSRQLADDLVRLVASVEKVVASLQRGRPAGTAVIEGRTVQTREMWRVRWSPWVGRNRPGVVDGAGAWVPVQSITREEELCTEVFNLSVDEDESYCADGILVHNCTPWSHAGKRKGIEDDRDMLVATCEIIRLLQPKAFLIGNVPGLDDSKNLSVVQKHIGGLAAYGYCTADFARLDAANFGVPQHRHRPFWYGHRPGTPCIQWPEPTHGDPDVYDAKKTDQMFLPMVNALSPWVTVRQALQHLPPEKIGRLVKVKKRESRDAHPPSPIDGPASTVKATDGSQYITVNDKNHAMSNPDKPGRTITRNTHGDGSVILLNDKHAPTDADAPSSTIRGGGEGHSAPHTVIMLNAKHPNAELDAPAPTMGAKQRGQGAQVLSLPGGNDMFPPSKPDEPAKALRAAGRTAYIEIPQGERIGDEEQPAVAITSTVPRVKQGADKVLGWPWDRPATTVQADERLAPPGHHDENFATRSLPNAVVISEEAGALLQGFPAGWKFIGKTKKARWSQIGQAMPPPLAHAVALSVRKQMGLEPPVEEGERVDSIGTCSMCGYHGPGPRHDCKPHLGKRSKKRSKPTTDMQETT